MKADLSDVTLYVLDTKCHDLTRLAIEECLARANFAEVLVVSDKYIAVSGGARHVQCEPAESSHALYEWATLAVPPHIRTSHALHVQYDSWIVDPAMWRPEFLALDYVAPPWWYKDGLNVGCGGFTLMSKRLMDFLAAEHERFPYATPWDHVLCRDYRPALEREGFRWATQAEASDFGWETIKPDWRSRHFGFHGIPNWAHVLSDEALVQRLEIARRIPYLEGRLISPALDNMRAEVKRRGGPWLI